jgi:hypothetical protein
MVNMGAVTIFTLKGKHATVQHMNKSDVLIHYKTHRAVAEALGISRAAVTQWPDLIPEKQAYRLERISNGALRVDPRVYEVRAQGAAA